MDTDDWQDPGKARVYQLQLDETEVRDFYFALRAYEDELFTDDYKYRQIDGRGLSELEDEDHTFLLELRGRMHDLAQTLAHAFGDELSIDTNWEPRNKENPTE